MRSVNLTMARDLAELEERFGGTARYIEKSALMGSPQEVADRIAEYRAAGAQGINVALRAPFDVAALDRFAADVLPLVS
jgi:alkanesulfonate monooxygenase SsuD/methylene tetrahydromethanopterin reductase-like flavin-dependent oxidoreductase (luciferase family)